MVARFDVVSGTGITGQTQGVEEFSDQTRLDFVRWHVDRYDKLRSSTSTRASVLLSANAGILAGSLLLANSRLQDIERMDVLGWFVGGVAVIIVALAATSVFYCVNAIATWKTTRTLHGQEIPSRFLFNWGDTIRAVDGYSNFATRVEALQPRAALNHGVAELWTGILQHKRRHKFLRFGVHAFRYAAFFFLVLVVVTLLVR